MERKIGETFEFEGKWLKVKEEDAKNACRNCYLVEKDCSMYLSIIGECLAKKRSDNKDIVFEDITYELEEQPQEEQPQELNLCEILKDCPKGEEFWSPLFGYVKLHKINHEAKKVVVISNIKMPCDINNDGTMLIYGVVSSEIMLFPSKEQRDWTKVKYEKKKERFDPKTLKAFDRVIVYGKNEGWFCSIFSHIGEGEYPYNTASGNYEWCIPYNDDTKHLVGTTKEAPEFYNYWED